MKVTEDTARKLFSDVTDVKNVDLEKFKETIGKLAADQKKTVEEFTNILGAEGPKLLNRLIASVSSVTNNAVSTLKTAAASTLKDTVVPTSEKLSSTNVQYKLPSEDNLPCTEEEHILSHEDNLSSEEEKEEEEEEEKK